MFKAFYWMLQRKDLCKSFLRLNIILLFMAFIIAVIFSLSCYFIFENTYVIYGVSGMAFTVCGALMLTWFVWGYFWELTASIIERKTDVLSSSVYGGKVSLVESIKLPEIEFFRFCWRGFSSSIAMLIMELPVFLLALTVVIFFDSSYKYVVLIVQLLMLFLSLGLFWNYAKNNSIFSMLNIYIAGYLLENHPLRYIWNSILNILNYILYYAAGILVALLLHISSGSDYTNVYTCIKLAVFQLIMLIPFFYMLHVQAYLVGTLSPQDDYL